MSSRVNWRKPQGFFSRASTNRAPREVRMLVFALLLAAAVEPPQTPRVPVTDTVQGVAVTDDYRWLESWGDEKVQKWSEEQNAAARAVLDNLPGVAVLRSRIAG